MNSVTVKSRTPSHWRAALVALAAALALVITAPASAKKIGKTTIPDSINVAGTDLTLRGAGYRKRAFLKLYLAGLYTNNSGDGPAVAAADEPMAIHLHVLSRLVTTDAMASALKDGFRRATGGDLAPVQAGLDQLIAEVKKAKIKPGSTYTILYTPDVGVTMQINGEDAYTIEGLAFKEAFYGVWLSDNTSLNKLKKKLLGS